MNFSVSEHLPINYKTPFHDNYYEDEPLGFDDYNYKVYHDGSHYVATRILQSSIVHREKPLGNPKYTNVEYFNTLYDFALLANYEEKAAKKFISQNLIDRFEYFEDDSAALDTFVENNMERRKHNQYARKKRFRRKARINRWNYFVTFTFDDKLHTEESFAKALRKCLSNLHTRRGWCYMGVTERGEDNDRLHYHFLMYIPEGQMVGEISEEKYYDKRNGTMEIAHINDFFKSKFGRNDFSEVGVIGQRLGYLLKYVEKSGNRIIYSRGIPSEIIMRLREDDVAAEMFDFGIKWVLYDDVMDYHKYWHNAKYEQMSFIL